MQKKVIYFLLITTIILSAALAYKIKKTPIYDPNTYSQVYEEFNKITTLANITASESDDFSISQKTTYIQKNSTGNFIGPW